MATQATSILKVEYLIDGRDRLLRRTFSEAGAPGAVQERVLFNNAADARFEFHDGLRWQDDWSVDAASQPSAVSILIDLPRYGDVRLSALARAS